MMNGSKPRGASGGGRRGLSPKRRRPRLRLSCSPSPRPLPPGRGRNIRLYFGDTTELGCLVPPKRKTQKRSATATSEFSSTVPTFSLSWERGLG